MVNEIPDSTNVILQFLRKRQRLSHQLGDLLTKSAVEPLNVISLSAIFAHRSMSFAWNDLLIGFPEVCVSDSTLSIDRGQSGP